MSIVDKISKAIQELLSVDIEKELEQLFDGNVIFVGFMLIVTALLLFFADKAKNTLKPVSFKKSIIIPLLIALCTYQN